MNGLGLPSGKRLRAFKPFLYTILGITQNWMQDMIVIVWDIYVSILNTGKTSESTRALSRVLKAKE